MAKNNQAQRESSATGSDLDADAFEIHRTVARDDIELAYIREGVGGVPLLLMNGWPGTKRIYYRNIRPLAHAGFEVVVADNRGWGDSPVPADKTQYADAPNTARDMHALMEQLGHEQWVVAGYDFGSMALQDMSARFPDQILRQVVWNGFSPHIPDEYAAAGITGGQFEEVAEVSDHMEIQGDPDALLAGLDTPEKRRTFIKGFYRGRVWREGDPILHLAAPGSFDDAAADFQAEPYDDAAVLRASLSFYEVAAHPELTSEPPLLMQRNDVTETMILYGMEDRVVGPKMIDRAKVAYGRLVGPFIIPGAGHFISWEQPEILNSAITCFCRDLLAHDTSS
jgi:pimeloyl-ACP methyl ester carboxylesterase